MPYILQELVQYRVFALHALGLQSYTQILQRQIRMVCPGMCTKISQLDIQLFVNDVHQPAIFCSVKQSVTDATVTIDGS